LALRAVVEIDGGELRIFPVCDVDTDERQIREALRLLTKEKSEATS
jgi:hypothetical protein